MTPEDWKRMQDSFADRLTPQQRFSALAWYLREAIAIAIHRFNSQPLRLTHAQEAKEPCRMDRRHQD